jgi:hypothetical protein
MLTLLTRKRLVWPTQMAFAHAPGDQREAARQGEQVDQRVTLVAMGPPVLVLQHTCGSQLCSHQRAGARLCSSGSRIPILGWKIVRLSTIVLLFPERIGRGLTVPEGSRGDGTQRFGRAWHSASASHPYRRPLPPRSAGRPLGIVSASRRATTRRSSR